MKWFKHDGNARGDEKIEKLLMKYGVEGYGLYFYCIEIIAGNLTSENITFDLKHDAETIAYRLKMDTLRVEEIMKFCVKEELFQVNTSTNRIMCLGLGKRLDVSTSNNPEVKKIISNYQKLLESNSRIEENRIEKNRLDTREFAGKPAQWSELHQQIEDSCLSQLADISQYNYGKERKHIKALAEKFETHDEPAEFAAAFFNTFYLLKHTNNKFWSSQPILPSIANSDSIYPRIVESMKKEPDYKPTGAEVTF